MSEEREKEILDELKTMNEKLNKLNEPRPLTTPLLLGIGMLGFLLLAPFLVDIFVLLVH
ncbi:hypothetical protein SAMN05192559_10334 [Halobacillus karajensis]|uniref:Uncharacterized protein n=1 Tax=Halobacillus karajensis TaxID=195088 RepID=A0A024P2X3_9BACI|nr:hypothetical protein [Halobacillus karajensis]CDQ20020.1 hypothetical protein BN982_02328 [Halobacillus karajensis]CDQ22480.1 hypothetical protein BN983_00689 [Halobacillus karajensis]CDQ28323.1 hypothetical protein BN981_02618 [Halobacillus karajensis]SEH67980.1 hypothetical protein SAMN05192559_10334 [Halobacillus karajensis]